jgi:flagellar biosynthesis/type III secretory pathway protein FliH
MGALLKKEQLTAQAGEIRPLYAPVSAPPPVLPRPPVEVGPEGGDGLALERHLNLLSRVIAETVASRERLLVELQPDLLALVLALVREIVGHEASSDPSVVEHTLTQALKQLHFATRLTAHLHPDDLRHLQEHPEITDALGGEVELVANDSVDRGGCRLDSDRGGLDATLATQLQSLAERLEQDARGVYGVHDAGGS